MHPQISTDQKVEQPNLLGQSQEPSNQVSNYDRCCGGLNRSSSCGFVSLPKVVGVKGFTVSIIAGPDDNATAGVNRHGQDIGFQVGR
jgi:hypothetical protein